MRPWHRLLDGGLEFSVSIQWEYREAGKIPPRSIGFFPQGW
ncbi:hypothetical protein NY78_0940 [Desulfovibrio sp. TomC]|nr:hypothetical protein NY78_0940 [Desulfovibrio sp. TomC]